MMLGCADYEVSPAVMLIFMTAALVTSVVASLASGRDAAPHEVPRLKEPNHSV